MALMIVFFGKNSRQAEKMVVPKSCGYPNSCNIQQELKPIVLTGVPSF